MCNKTGNLVAETLAGDDGNLFADLFVDVKVHRQTGVVLLDDHPRRLLNGLGTDATLEKIAH